MVRIKVGQLTKTSTPFIERLRTQTSTDDTLKYYCDDELSEGLLRSASAGLLINKIRKLGNDIKKAKTTDKKLELIGTQNLYIGMLMFAMTQFEPKSKK